MLLGSVFLMTNFKVFYAEINTYYLKNNCFSIRKQQQNVCFFALKRRFKRLNGIRKDKIVFFCIIKSIWLCM